MLRAENLDPQDVIRFLPHASDTSSLTIAANGIAQPLVDRLWINQSLNERLAIPHRKLQMLVVLDGAPRRVLYAC